MTVSPTRIIIVLACITSLSVATNSPARGKAILEVIIKSVLGVGESGMLKTLERSEDPNQHAKVSLNPKNQSFRGSFTGVLVNESNNNVSFPNNPVFEEALISEFGRGYDIERSKLKVSASGKARGKFKGTFAPF